MAYKDTILTDTPILYTTFDEAGSTVADSSTAARTVTAVNGPTKVTGISGTALQFDGTNDYVTAASVADHTSGSFTWEVWFKSTQTTGVGTFIRRDGNGAAYLLRLNAGKIEWYANSAGGMITSATVKADGQWHHAVGVKNGTSTTLYVDGVSAGTGTAVSTATGTTTTYLGSAGGTTEYFNGTLDEVAVYNTALTSTRVLAHYNARSLPDVTVSVPAAAMTVTTPNVTATAINSYLRVVSSVADRSASGNGTATTMLVGYPSDQALLDFEDLTFPAGTYVQSATLELTANNGVSTVGGISSNYTVDRLTQSFTEAETGTKSVQSHNVSFSAPDTYASGQKFTVNITPIVQAWADGQPQYGVAISKSLSGASDDLVLATRESATTAWRPKLTVQLAATPAANINVSIPPASLSVSAPSGVTLHTSNKQSVPAATTTVSAVAPTVTAGKNIRIGVPAAVLNMSVPGGTSRNPDYRAIVTPAEAWIFTPNAKGFGGTDAKISVTAAQVSVAAAAPVLDLVTHRRTFVTPAAMTLRAVGMYNAGLDRYMNIVPTTAEADDVWLKMEETGGTVAFDALISDEAGYTDNGVYAGGPVFQEEGPYLRKAVTFDGVDDFILMTTTYDTTFSDMDATIEFSIKTTDLSGTVIRGGGRSTNNSNLTSTTDAEVRLINGELAIVTGGTNSITYRTRKFVSDGQWHHIVISIPSASAWIYDAYHISAAKPAFIAVDGQTVWTRYAFPLMARTLLPSSVMARAVYVGGNANTPTSYSVSEHVAGSMRDLIVRSNYAVSQNTAAKLYYEWSESTVVTVAPAQLSVTAVDPFKAKGNVKRMLALYGLPHYLDEGFNQPTFRDGFGTYYSVFAGFFIDNVPNSGSPAGPGGAMVNIPNHSNGIHMQFLPVRPFMLEGYMVYPLAVANTPGSSGVNSAAGIENGEYRDPITKDYVDDRTGLPRFVDLDKDLMEDVTAFDAITAVNYPAVRPWDGSENVNNDALQEFRQHNLGLTNSEWTSARDALRDSILKAAYRGVNLWITEPHMAEHIGVIQGYDKHHTGARYEFYGPGNIDATGYTNKRGEQVDDAHIDETKPGATHKVAGVGYGQFNFTWQANAKRKIIATEPGLTTLPSYEMTEKIHYQGDSAWTPHNSVIAHDIVDRSGGLSVGDQIVMEMWEQNDYDGNYPAFNNWSVGNPRKFIVSARPQGIVGKPISKEMDFYYGPNGQVLNNQWKDNIYTIAVERGSVVRGGAIGGRIFVELMDPQTTQIKLAEDRDKSMWSGEVGVNASSWSFDTRRYREIIVTTIVEKTLTRSPTEVVNVKTEERYIDIQDPDLIFRPYMSMNARGLNWLAKTETLDPGAVKVYVPSAEVTVSTPAVKHDKTRNVTISVTGAARMDVEARRPRNFQGPDVHEKVLPAVLNIETRGIGKRIMVGAAELTVSTPDVRATGDGESIYVYMDADREVTLFLKED